ncbi:MAG: hypothetical protein M3321_00940 [Actinomycetota bacterium]|nr:hypothetical protein [Actinomycetota bacterium]
MRYFTRTALLALVLVVVGGAANGVASTTEKCSPGRPFCVAISDTDGVSPSTGGARYLSYALTVRNTGTSRLTNGRAVLTLTDVVAGTDQSSTAVFQPADSTGACSFDVAGNVLTWTLPNLAAGKAVTCDPLVFSTSTTAGATATRLDVDVQFKEKGSDNQPTDPQQDRLLVSETTSYEGSGDLDASFARTGKTTTLGTDPADDQSTAFGVPVPSNASAFVASVGESATAGSFCPTCLGEIVTTVGGGVFSASNPIQLLTTWKFLPSGKNEKNIAVNHVRDDSTLEVITAPCGGAIGQLPPPGRRPCRTVSIDHGPGGAVTVRIYTVSNGNGEWGFS